jgi:hypothetical protein
VVAYFTQSRHTINVKLGIEGMEKWAELLKEFKYHITSLSQEFDRTGAAMKLGLTGYQSLGEEGGMEREYRSVNKLYQVVAMTILTEDQRKHGDLPKVLAGPKTVVAASAKAARDQFIAEEAAAGEWDLDWTEVAAVPFVG